jgi:hypothetical protein
MMTVVGRSSGRWDSSTPRGTRRGCDLPLLRRGHRTLPLAVPLPWQLSLSPSSLSIFPDPPRYPGGIKAPAREQGKVGRCLPNPRPDAPP